MIVVVVVVVLNKKALRLVHCRWRSLAFIAVEGASLLLHLAYRLDSHDYRHTRDRSVSGLGRHGIRRGRNA